MKTLCVTDSQNTKTGKVRLATYRTQDTCPDSCIFMGSGCYGENNANRLFGFASNGDDGLDILAMKIGMLRPGHMVRLNVVGDYLMEDGTPDTEYIAVTNTIPSWADVLTYTHAWRTLTPGLFEDHVRPNASCNTIADVRDALAAGWKAVVVDPDGGIPGMTIDGEKAVSCPFETHGRQCIDCGLCARGKRSSVVVFQAHGSGAKHARRAILEQRALEVLA